MIIERAPQQGFVLIAAMVFALLSALLVHAAVQRALIDARLADDLAAHLYAYNAATNLMNALIAEVDTAARQDAPGAGRLDCLSDRDCLAARLTDNVEAIGEDFTQRASLRETAHRGPLRLPESRVSSSDLYQHQFLEATVTVDGKGRAAHAVLLAVPRLAGQP